MTTPGLFLIYDMKNRILPKQVPTERKARIEAQGNKCALCNMAFMPGDRIHLDHNHDTGKLRGALHGGCNMLLGKIERGLKRGIKDPEGFMRGVHTYIAAHTKHPDELFHPTWLTAEEKRLKAKKRALRKKKSMAKTS